MAYYRKRPVVVQAVQWTGNRSLVMALVGTDLPTYGDVVRGMLQLYPVETLLRVFAWDTPIKGVAP